jgi:hypothetical protein
MTEGEWLRCADPLPMLQWLGYRLTQRHARLFACACCRRVEHCLKDDRMHRILDVAERAAEGLATKAQRMAAMVEAFHVCAGAFTAAAYTLVQGQVPHPADAMPDLAVTLAVGDQPVNAYLFALDAGRPLSEERTEQAAILRDIVGWLPRAVVLRPEWLTDTVRELAEAVAIDGDFGRLPVLADALEEAGCLDEALLGHCRDRMLKHVRGCWVVRHLTGPG